MTLELIEKREVTRIVNGEESCQLENSTYRILDNNNNEAGFANIGQSYFGFSMSNTTITVEKLTEIINNL